MSACGSKKIQFQAQGLSSSLKIDEAETMLVKKQGIVTILGSDCERNMAAPPSLRRTISADMSSKKWLPQNVSSPMKKIASSEQLFNSKITADSFSSSSSEGEDDCEEGKELEAEAEAEAERDRLEIWTSIQREKKKEQEKAGQFETWSAILSSKANEDISKSLPITPYIHPIAKRSKSSLSQKSLEICTESLGSETGSDGFSSYPPSETSEAEEDKEEKQEQQQQQQQQQQPEKVMTTTEATAYEPEEEELQVPKYNYAASANKKSPPRSFPPPLPSLSLQLGQSIHMRSHRDNGRLVLRAVSVPPQDNFCVQRRDGRLVLTFANHRDHEESKEDAAAADESVAEKEEKDRMEELEEEFGGLEEDDQEGKEHEEVDDEDDEAGEEDVEEIECDGGDEETVIEKAAPLLSTGITSVHRLALVMNNKQIGLVNRNPKWSEKFNEVANFEDVNVVEVEPSSVARSLPPRPRVARLIPSTPSAAAAAAGGSFNAYEYFWRTKPTTKGAPVLNPLTHPQNNYNSPLKNNSGKFIVTGDVNPTSNEQQQLLVLRRKNGDYLVHNFKSCKDSRRSFMFWEPYCIATS